MSDVSPERPGVVAGMRSWARARAEQLESRFRDLRGRITVVDVAARTHERDRDAAGTLLGSALALRLFLFFVPMLLLGVGLTGIFGGWLEVAEISDEAGVSTRLAEYVDTAVTQSGRAPWVAAGLGFVGVVVTGRSLARALVLSSALSWRLGGRQPLPVRAIGVVVGLFVGLVLASTITNRIRLASGLALTSMSMIAVFAVYLVLWLLLYQSLPRATTDPGAALPGAAIVSLTMTVLQGVTQLYLPNQIASASSLYGGLGVLVTFLGWFFFLGRAIAFSFAVNAVVYEQVGSVSVFVFRLPLIRQIPRRLPVVARYFAVDYVATGDPGTPPDGVGLPLDSRENPEPRSSQQS